MLHFASGHAMQRKNIAAIRVVLYIASIADQFYFSLFSSHFRYFYRDNIIFPLLNYRFLTHKTCLIKLRWGQRIWWCLGDSAQFARFLFLKIDLSSSSTAQTWNSCNPRLIPAFCLFVWSVVEHINFSYERNKTHNYANFKALIYSQKSLETLGNKKIIFSIFGWWRIIAKSFFSIINFYIAMFQ